MRKLIFALLICCLAGCATQQPPPPRMVVINDPPGTEPAEPEPMTGKQIRELERRLDQLRVGMPRDKVLDILNMPSLYVRYYESSRQTKITYHIKLGHELVLEFIAGDYETTWKSAFFDGKFWPRDKPSQK